MRKKLLLLIGLSLSTAHAQTTTTDLLPLRSCAHAVSKTIEGRRIIEGWSSDDENSFLFLTCDDDLAKGKDHYVFTANGIYYYFIKAHKDYKGGLEPTQFRLSIENATYYLRTNIVAGMGNSLQNNKSQKKRI